MLTAEEKMDHHYKCPICGDSLCECGKSYICKSSHTFDISKEGYVNLAIGKHDSGDSAEMCMSRRRFLARGYYRKFAELIASTVAEFCSPDMLVDCGCGEGYYLRVMREHFPSSSFFGIDLAKEAIRLAAKSEKQVSGTKNSYCVCGIFSLPFHDESADAVISVFAPVGEQENHRVLKNGGYMFVAGPGKNHLSGLKSAIYESPYENPEKHREYEGFEFIGTRSVAYDVRVNGEDILDLFTMTPYFWRTSKEDTKKLENLDFLDTTLDFVVSVYRKI